MSALPSTLSIRIENYTKTSSVRIIENTFGDGYSQRVPDGINTIINKATVELTGDYSDIATYDSYFSGLQGADNFTWTPPGESSTSKWICKTWSIITLSNNTYSLTAEFERVYDL